MCIHFQLRTYTIHISMHHCVVEHAIHSIDNQYTPPSRTLQVKEPPPSPPLPPPPPSSSPQFDFTKNFMIKSYCRYCCCSFFSFLCFFFYFSLIPYVRYWKMKYTQQSHTMDRDLLRLYCFDTVCAHTHTQYHTSLFLC